MNLVSRSKTLSNIFWRKKPRLRFKLLTSLIGFKYIHKIEAAPVTLYLLEKIDGLLKEKNARLFIFLAPMNNNCLENKRTKYYSWFKNLLQTHFKSFNVIYGEESLKDYSDNISVFFLDHVHFNEHGSRTVSGILMERMTDTGIISREDAR